MKKPLFFPTSLTIALVSLLLLWVAERHMTHLMVERQEANGLALTKTQISQILTLEPPPQTLQDSQTMVSYLEQLHHTFTLELPRIIQANGHPYPAESLLPLAEVAILWQGDGQETPSQWHINHQGLVTSSSLSPEALPTATGETPEITAEQASAWVLQYPLGDQGWLEITLPRPESTTLGETSSTFLTQFQFHSLMLVLGAMILVQATLGRLPSYLRSLTTGQEKKPGNLLETTWIKQALWELFQGLQNYIAEIQGLHQAYQPYISPKLLQMLGKPAFGQVVPGDRVTFSASVVTIYSNALEEAQKQNSSHKSPQQMALLNQLMERLHSPHCVMVCLDDFTLQGIFPQNLPHALEVANHCGQWLSEMGLQTKATRACISVVNTSTTITVLGNPTSMGFYPHFDQRAQMKRLIHYGTALKTSVLFRHCDLPSGSDLPKKDTVRLCTQGWDSPDGRLYEDFSADPPSNRQGKLASKESYDLGLDCFYKKEYLLARDAWMQALRLHPEDPLAQAYFQACDHAIYGQEQGETPERMSLL